ncbi:hypothetical protein K438DRAFT_1991478 [Mycena galopus ATCC 62051]|nr:hypothetical protein K438DRAFT_1991478 [Mycena galopus ATCC 62051]
MHEDALRCRCARGGGSSASSKRHATFEHAGKRASLLLSLTAAYKYYTHSHCQYYTYSPCQYYTYSLCQYYMYSPHLDVSVHSLYAHTYRGPGGRHRRLSLRSASQARSGTDPARTHLTALLDLPKPPMRTSLLATALVHDVLRHAAVEPKMKTASHMFDLEAVKSYIMGCAHRGELAVRIDEPFGDVLDTPSPSASPSKDGRDGVIQPSAAGLVCTRLGSVACCLHNTLEIIEPAATSTSTPEEEQATFAALAQSIQKECKALQLRRALVTRRRELLAKLAVRKEKEDAVRHAEVAKREKEEAERRAREETKFGAGVEDPGGREGGGCGASLCIVAERVDHIERANRKEERPLLVLDYKQVADRAMFVTTKVRLQRMVGEYEKRRGEVIKKQGKEYARRKDAAGRKIEEEKAKRRKTVAAKREEERKAVEEAKRDKDIQLTLN